MELYEHQKEALDFIKDKKVFALGMEMGTGKTAIALHHAERLYKTNSIDTLIVVSTNSAYKQWVTEQAPLFLSRGVWEGLIWERNLPKRWLTEFKKSLSTKKLLLFACNVEAFRAGRISDYVTELIERRSCMLIVDESHKIKNGRRRPKRGKRAGALQTNKLLDLSLLVEYKGIMSGTLSPNSPFDLWSQFEFLEPNFFGLDYYLFERKHGYMMRKRNPYGGDFYALMTEGDYRIIKSVIENIKESVTDVKEYSQRLHLLGLNYGLDILSMKELARSTRYEGYRDLEQIKKAMNKVTFFKKKADCLELPDKVMRVLEVDMTKEQKGVYTKLKRDLYAEYKGKELTLTTKIALLTRLQQISGGVFPSFGYDEEGVSLTPIDDNPKIKALLEDLEQIDKDVQVIVWARFTKEVQIISAALKEAGYSNREYRGGSPFSVIEDFQAGKFKILVSNPQKGAESLNLQCATYHYFYSNTFRADIRQQAEDRSHRIGQKNNVTYTDIIAKGSLDGRILQVLRKKGEIIDFFRTNDIAQLLKEVDV